MVGTALFLIEAEHKLAQAPDFTRLSAEGVAKISLFEKMQAQHYFRAHSLGFPATFSAHHPGPYWLLKRKGKFNLTEEQTKQENALKLAMARSTLADEAVLQQASRTYAADSAKPNPSVEQITADIAAVGKAQTSLASEMVVYHVASYALLNQDQKKLYQALVSSRSRKSRE